MLDAGRPGGRMVARCPLAEQRRQWKRRLGAPAMEEDGRVGRRSRGRARAELLAAAAGAQGGAAAGGARGGGALGLPRREPERGGWGASSAGAGVRRR